MKRKRLLPPQLLITGKLSLLIISLLAGSGAIAQTPAWSAPAGAADQKNPVVANPSILAEAKVLYAANCGPCHGEKGRGDGPAAQGLTPKPADHSSTLVQNESDGSLFWKMSEGKTPMPAYGKVFTDQQRWELVCYIRSLAKTSKKK
jgi:mono/diheme cytochrome c family protein